MTASKGVGLACSSIELYLADMSRVIDLILISAEDFSRRRRGIFLLPLAIRDDDSLGRLRHRKGFEGHSAQSKQRPSVSKRLREHTSTKEESGS